MKKVILFFAIFSVAILVAAEKTETAPANKSNATVSASRLNVRMKPTIKSPKAGTLLKGERIQVIGKEGAWVEIAAPQTLKLYVSEVYLINGKLVNATNLRAGRSASAPSFGVLPAGTVLKAVGASDRYGWIQVEPPQDIKVYAYSDYITLDNTAVLETKAAEKEVQKPNAPATTDTDAEAKAAPAVKAEKAEKPAEQTEKTEKAEKPAAPVAAAPEVPAEKPFEGKSAAEKPAKTEKKAVEKKADSSELSKKLAADLAALGAAPTGEKVTVTGKLYRIPASNSPVSDYAVFKDDKNQGYVCGNDAKFFEKNVGKELSVTGKAYKIKGWKSLIVVAD